MLHTSSENIRVRVRGGVGVTVRGRMKGGIRVEDPRLATQLPERIRQDDPMRRAGSDLTNLVHAAETLGRAGTAP
jgi:hypothetical protein